MEKVIRDGKVAVLHSEGWGAGWYTHFDNERYPGCLFDPEIVDLVEHGATAYSIQQLAESKWQGFNGAGAIDLRVSWVPVGQLFQMKEDGGLETIEFLDTESWILA